MKTVLIVEDDENVREPLRNLLEREGYHVLLARNLGEARNLLKSDVHLLILDWNLPDGEGLDWLVGQRKAGFTQPVIMLTARGDLVDRVMGLEFGANDYMTKPFESRELLARIRVQLRGHRDNAAEVLRYGQLELNLTAHEARLNGGILHLTQTEFDLLKFLLQRPGRAFTRDEIMEAVWNQPSSSETRALDNCVLQLRKKIGEDVIQTVRGVGYKIRVAE